MKELLLFMLGLMVGGLIGTTIMCGIQINRVERYQNKKKTN